MIAVHVCMRVCVCTSPMKILDQYSNNFMHIILYAHMVLTLLMIRLFSTLASLFTHMSMSSVVP